MPDPTELMMNSLNDSVYDDLLKEASIDNRLGAHDAIVGKVVVDAWEDGRPRQKVQFVLLTANNAKADLTMSPLPTPDQIREEKDSWDAGRKRGIAHSITLYRQLSQHYGLTVNPATGMLNFQEGQRYRVQTGKRSDKNDRAKYFITVVAFLSKDHAVGAEAAAQAASGEPAPAF